MSIENADGPLRGKACLVTGATSGIGEVTARELARIGAEVIVVGRSAERCAATLDRIHAATGSTSVRSYAADLSSRAEVERLAEEVRRDCPRLDVLVNNAGGMFPKRQESADGLEMTLALNHLSYFRLTNALLPLLLASAPARIVSVASDAHRGPAFDFNDFQRRTRYSGWRAYQQTKLANVLFTFELARRLQGTGVTANALHPGFVRTRFFEKEGALAWLLRRVAPLAAISPEQGAQTSIHLASSPAVAGASGQYFVKCRPARSSPQSLDQAAAERLWRASEELSNG